MPSVRNRSVKGGTAPSLNPDNTLPADPAEKNPVSRAGAKVTVCCKVPKGLQLRIFRMEDFPVPVMGGGTRTEKKAITIGEPVFARGPKTPFGLQPKFAVIGDYALTPNVDADFWERWLEQNQDLDVVRNKLIFAQASPDRAAAQAEEQAEILSNLEPLNPETKQIRVRGKLVEVPADPRAPRTGPNLDTVKKAEFENA